MSGRGPGVINIRRFESVQSPDRASRPSGSWTVSSGARGDSMAQKSPVQATPAVSWLTTGMRTELSLTFPTTGVSKR